MDEQFISEPITPDARSFSPDAMSRGLASLPSGFTWRDRSYRILECLSHEKVTQREGHSKDGDRYLRREQFHVRLDSGQTASIYVLRQAPTGSSRAAAKKRWFLYTISPEPSSSEKPSDKAEEG